MQAVAKEAAKAAAKTAATAAAKAAVHAAAKAALQAAAKEAANEAAKAGPQDPAAASKARLHRRELALVVHGAWPIEVRQFRPPQLLLMDSIPAAREVVYYSASIPRHVLLSSAQADVQAA